MYHVLAAEMENADGDPEQVAREYLEAALGSDDVAVAERATKVALAARAWQYASMAADRWVQLAPDDIEARMVAVRTFLVSGDYEQAGFQLSGLLDLTGNAPWQGWKVVAESLGGAQNAEKAEAILNQLIEEHDAGDNPWALLARSQLAAREEDRGRAAGLAMRAIEAAPDEPAPRLWAGRLALTGGDRDQALDHFQAAWAIDPAERATALAYANLLRRSGEGGTANEVLASLPDTPENRFTRVMFAVETEDGALADSLYQGFGQPAASDDPELAFNAARSAELLGYREQAIDWYALLEGTPRELLALQRRAMLLAEEGRVQEARDLLQYARNSGRTDIQLETLLVESQILVDADERGEAVDVLDRAVDQFGDEPRLLYTRALVSVEMNRIDAAEADLRQVLENDPNNANALNALGYTLADLTNRLDEAEALINAAYELQPDEPAIVDSMGWIAYRFGRLDEAESYLRQAFTMDRNAEIAAHLGEVLWTQGRHDEARLTWREGLGIDADNRVLNETMKRLDNGQ